MENRATAWSITINNPVQADEENIALARQKGWKVEGQKERGEQGTLHYQLLVKTPQVRFSAVKKAFPRAHIEIARNIAALQTYVHKEETREGQLRQDQSLYPSLQTLWDMLAEWIQDTNRHHEWYDADGDQRLDLFDKFIGEKIDEGYILETTAVNPQIRGSVKRYGENIYNRSLRRQTDRQTDSDNSSVSTITNASHSSQASQDSSLP